MEIHLSSSNTHWYTNQTSALSHVLQTCQCLFGDITVTDGNLI
jgi:hypothetical protein